MTRLLVLITWLALAATVLTQTPCETNCTAEAGQAVVVTADTVSGASTYDLTMNGAAVPGAPPPTFLNGSIQYGLPLGLVPGVYVFWLQAYDLARQLIAQWTNTLTVISATDTTPPTVDVPRWSRSGRSQNVSITGTASDAESGLRSLSVFFDGKLLASCAASPCAASTKARTGTITVTASDNAGNRNSNSAQIR